MTWADVAGPLASVVGSALVCYGVVFTQRSGERVQRDDSALAAWKDLLSPLQARVGELETEAAASRTWRRLAVAYIRTLVHTHPDPPQPPAGFEVEEG